MYSLDRFIWDGSICPGPSLWPYGAMPSQLFRYDKLSLRVETSCTNSQIVAKNFVRIHMLIKEFDGFIRIGYYGLVFKAWCITCREINVFKPTFVKVELPLLVTKIEKNDIPGLKLDVCELNVVVRIEFYIVDAIRLLGFEAFQVRNILQIDNLLRIGTES